GGGGGAGGSVWIASDRVTLTGAVTAVGGAGGARATNDSSVGGAGGAGSMGRIRIDAPTISGTTTPTYVTLAPGTGGTGVGVPLRLEQVDDDTVELYNTSGADAELRLILV